MADRSDQTYTGPGKTGGPNQEQAAAIASDSRHILVTAGPGTGKTYTLTARVTALLEAGHAPERMAAITFTVKAADEVRERLLKAAEEACERVFVGTFHQFCLHWLRHGVPDLAAIGPEDRERLLKRLFPGLGATERNTLSEEISGYFLSPTGAGDHLQTYLDELQRLNALDLDAVVPEFIRRLEADAGLLRLVRASVEHLFVDEFQDLNQCQFDLIRLLAETGRIFAIGDPDQAIYGFRGAIRSFSSVSPLCRKWNRSS